jgi:Flp pilus assembly protein protease CpaA
MIALLIVIGIFLTMVSVIDIKYRAVPSIILTGFLFAIAFLNPNNLFFGILGFILGYLLFESGYIGGVADIKIFTLLSFMVSSQAWFFIFIILTLVYGMVWKGLVKWKFNKETEFAFIPVFLFTYISMVILGGIR